MASPTKKRTALAGKSTNIRQTPGGVQKNISTSSRTSPGKRSQVNLSYALSNSPVRSVSISPRRSNDSTVFTFHEETPSERAATLMMHMSISKQFLWSADENDFSLVKENLSPRKAVAREQSPRKSSKRRHLQELSIKEYPGSVEYPHSNDSFPLTLHYKHKTVLPSFVTPPRDQQLRECFTTSNTSQSLTQGSRTTDDVPKDKVIRKLTFKICEN